MCAEFTPGQPLEVEKLLVAISHIKNVIRNDYNFRAFPRNIAPILIQNSENELEMLEAEFSLIPTWWNPEKAAKKTKTGRPVFATHNARLESIDEKPTFKESFQNRHCVIPMSEFFESSLFGTKFAGNRIRLSTGGILLAAGCHSEWLDKATGEVILSFTIITHLPSHQLFESGHDRMPVFLDPKMAMQWLNNEGDSLAELKDFLLQNTISRTLDMNVTIDRALKEGWQKNAPSEEDIESIGKLVLGA